MKTTWIISLIFVGWTFLSARPVHGAADTLVDTIYSQVDILPRFKGGSKQWNSFVQKNLRIGGLLEDMDEEEYKKYGFAQRAQLEFTVCEDGKVCDVTVVNQDKISPAFVEEVLRLMERSPKWKPGEREGQPVKTRFRQQIAIDLHQFLQR